jgi:hypothetical protein
LTAIIKGNAFNERGYLGKITARLIVNEDVSGKDIDRSFFYSRPGTQPGPDLATEAF